MPIIAWPSWHGPHPIALLSNAAVGELGTRSVVESIWHDLLDLLRKTLLESLWDLGVTCSVAHLTLMVFVSKCVWR